MEKSPRHIVQFIKKKNKQARYLVVCILCYLGFPGSSTGKESACSAGDSSLIPGSGRSPGEGIGYPLKYSWASLVAQTVNNLPALWEARV